MNKFFQNRPMVQKTNPLPHKKFQLVVCKQINLKILNDIHSIVYKEKENEDEEEKNENELIINKCSLDEHKDIDALFYCQECKVKMCNKCEKVHSGFLKKHHIYSLDKDIKEIFTGLCVNKNHSLELEFYCKNHNKLCCAACLSKIKIKGKGQHKNCEVYHITKIKNSKKQNLEKILNI